MKFTFNYVFDLRRRSLLAESESVNELVLPNLSNRRGDPNNERRITAAFKVRRCYSNIRTNLGNIASKWRAFGTIKKWGKLVMIPSARSELWSANLREPSSPRSVPILQFGSNSVPAVTLSRSDVHFETTCGTISGHLGLCLWRQ